MGLCDQPTAWGNPTQRENISTVHLGVYQAGSTARIYSSINVPPKSSSLFFVAKKDGGLRPCIDYSVLNSQTIK